MNFKIGGINSVTLTTKTWLGLSILSLIMAIGLFWAGYKTGAVTACGHREPWIIPTPGGGYQLILSREFFAFPVIGEFGMEFIDRKRKDAN